MKLSILLLKLENIFYFLTLMGGTETVPPIILNIHLQPLEKKNTILFLEQ